jgi:protein-L-isoaspartate(D-aspartate) O-methyltransferase
LEDSYRHRGMRNQLIKKLEQKGINNPIVLQAMSKVPRHFFLDQAFLEHAYQDKAFPIGEGQTISQPYTVAVQTQLLQLQPGMKVLEIGTGSGYQCSILAELGCKVFSIERIKPLYDKAKSLLTYMGYKVNFYYGDGTLGIPSQAPYDRIIVTAGAPVVPETLLDQLSNNGILVIPVGDTGTQKMLKITKDSSGNIQTQEYGNFSFVPLKGTNGWK